MYRFYSLLEEPALRICNLRTRREGLGLGGSLDLSITGVGRLGVSAHSLYYLRVSANIISNNRIRTVPVNVGVFGIVSDSSGTKVNVSCNNCILIMATTFSVIAYHESDYPDYC